MDNEETSQEGSENISEGNNAEGIQSKAISELDRADEIVKRQKAENDRREELIKREEAIMARRAVGGSTVGYQERPVKKKPTDEEYTEKFLKGEVNPFKD